VRLWEHQVAADVDACAVRVLQLLKKDVLDVCAWPEAKKPGRMDS
jgi:hypothetical protein